MGAHVSAADFECSPARAGQRHGPGLGRHLMMNSVCSCVTSKCSKPTRSSAFVSNNRIVAPTWGLFAEARRSLANYFSAQGCVISVMWFTPWQRFTFRRDYFYSRLCGAMGDIITAQFGPREPCPKCGRPINQHGFQEYVICHERECECEHCQRLWTENSTGELTGAVCNHAIYKAHAQDPIDHQLLKRRHNVEDLLAVVCFGFLFIMTLLHPEPLFTAWRVLVHLGRARG